VAHDERETSSGSPDADPAVTSGLESGGGVAPGDTPPVSDSTSGAAGEARRNNPNMGPVSGNRTPMIVTLVILALLVVAVAGFTVASLVAS